MRKQRKDNLGVTHSGHTGIPSLVYTSGAAGRSGKLEKEKVLFPIF